MGIYPQFDRSRLQVKPLGERVHDLSHSTLLELEEQVAPLDERAMADITVLGTCL